MVSEHQQLVMTCSGSGGDRSDRGFMCSEVCGIVELLGFVNASVISSTNCLSIEPATCLNLKSPFALVRYRPSRLVGVDSTK